MAKQRYTTEEIIHKLREADVLIGQGQTIAQVTKQIGVTE
ncbi:MAG: IS3 family transposase, partial [Betaproteobacteria bacterium]|nr:IS3 family transposase [Betaproteobacteria bacterium]